MIKEEVVKRSDNPDPMENLIRTFSIGSTMFDLTSHTKRYFAHSHARIHTPLGNKITMRRLQCGANEYQQEWHSISQSCKTIPRPLECSRLHTLTHPLSPLSLEPDIQHNGGSPAWALCIRPPGTNASPSANPISAISCSPPSDRL